MPAHDADLETLLDYLKRSRGFDFTGYKRATLTRRIEKRMQMVSQPSAGDYLDYLEVHPEEFALLFNTILINVTSFFRDRSTWEFVAATLIPELISRLGQDAPIRVWSAGCASGEEAYTLAMLFAEALGPDDFRARVKIYATDADEEALAKARLAAYSEREVADVPPDLLTRYFEVVDSAYVFRKDLRRHVIFGRHDLIQDAPISRVDLLACRNTLMYFNAETQARILGRFHFALADDGYLILGRAETLMAHATTFAPVDLKRRISVKLRRNGHRARGIATNGDAVDGAAVVAPSFGKLREIALDGVATAQLVVDNAGTLVAANERARSMFGIPRADIGRPLHDLKVSYRPIELRAAVDRAVSDRRPVLIRDVEWQGAAGHSDERSLEVYVVPLIEVGGDLLGASVSFTDVTVAKRLQRDLERANQELESAYEELQSTNEELETTNEELQSTVEELETTNEELQSTNEELETMNEELQSTNEELHTMNDELRERGDEITQLNSFLESILTSLRGGVTVVDTDLRVLVWNQGAEDLWGLRESEVRGKNLLGLDIGLPTERLKQPLRACLTAPAEFAELTLDAINRRGKAIRCQVVCTALITPANEVRGAILAMNDIDKAGHVAPTLMGRMRSPSGDGVNPG